MASRAKNLVLFSLSCFLPWLCTTTYSQTATIGQGQQLKHYQQLVSNSGMFKLGFKSVHHNNSYLGIWYYGDDDNLLWVANRDTPISGTSGILEIDDHGNLIIVNEPADPFVLYSVEEPSNTNATLEDSGNFVLHELSSDGSIKQVLWQSFDHPTDTLLPGMKLGINSKTGLNWSLTSWRSDMSPASGSFTLGLDPRDTSQLVIWWRGETYWKSGSFLQGSSLVALVNGSYNFGFISNENETYFNYTVKKAVTIFPRLKLNPEGELVSSRADSVALEVSCTKNLSVGCLKQNIPACRSLGNKVFQHHTGFMSNTGFKFSQSDNLSRIDCQAECLHDCSCVAYASKNDDGTGCEIWSTGISFTESITRDDRSDVRRDIFILEPRENKWWIWLIIVLGGLMVVPPLCSICYVIWKWSKRRGDGKMNQRMLLNEIGGGAMPSTSNENGLSRKKDGHDNQLDVFSFESIAASTNYFSVGNKLGEGGFGPVYKGKLLDGREIAVKRLSSHSGQGLLEFKNEAILIAKLQHTNLVRLLGFCIQGEEKILIYEYMPNKSLDFFIFDSDRKYRLNWKKRFNIIEGITQGLLYLHKYSRLKVIHRDLKAGNILLDDEMNPKISDFGMARIFGLNESEANTKRVVGTYGYMSPEYAFRGIVSIKTDVFSFGVLLLEIVSGKKNNCCYHSDRPLNLIGYAWQLWNEGRGLVLIDPILDESCNRNEALRCIHVGLLCVQDRAIDRPTMPDVVSMLSNETVQLPAPKQPAFFIYAAEEEPDIADVKSNKCSINYVSVSVMEAR
ncbi:Serine/threonine-protein kinase PBS1, putative [Theobroma cacao]|uniref:Receptor-like serine/threonine-protein kinase n=1 Tax=Theobroma cacao TaxID=3641 RepID=A0A061GA93_THECC|nr:Serine/threonine-protein kinase PBS1, putative [Theobroma cacao]